MLRSVKLAALAAAVAIVALSGAAGGQVVISQVNGNGGLSGDVYDRDFVELFNRGATPVSLNGWSLQLFGDSGTSGSPFTPNWTMLPLSGTILPGQYLLVVPVTTRGGLGSSFSLQPLPPADIMATPDTERNLSPSANGVALMSSTATLASGECPVGRADLVDFVRYGLSNALCYEGPGPAVAIAAGFRAAVRPDGGCFDVDSSDLDVLVNQFASPRNKGVNAFVSATVDVSLVTNTAGTSVLLEVRRENAPCNPITGALTSATADLSAFGLSANQALFDDQSNGDVSFGDGTFSFLFTIPAGQAPGRYDIPVNGTRGGTTLDSAAVVRVLPPPAANDVCANAMALAGTGVLFDGYLNTTQATPDEDAGTCNGDVETKFSVWFSYTPPMTGAIRVEETSPEDIVTSIHPGCGAASTTCQRSDTGASIPVEGGVPVWIQVGQETGTIFAPQAPLRLTLSFEAAPANDGPCGAVEIPLEMPVVLTPNAGATAAIEAGINVSCDQGTNPPEARRGVWYRLTTGERPGALEFLESSINFSVMTVFSAPSCAGPFVEVGCVTESSTGPFVALEPDTTYYVLVSLSTFSVVPSQPYNITLTYSSAPVNDDACGAEALTTLPATRTVYAKGAQPDFSAGTSSTCSGTATRLFGVWYVYDSGPAETGALHIYDTSPNDLFYVTYTGSDCNVLTPHQCYGQFNNDDIFMSVQPSTRYWILVSLQSTSVTAIPTGPYELHFERIPVAANDLACNATEITGTVLHDEPGAPTATADVDTSCNFSTPAQTTTGYGVWYTIQPAGPVTLKCQDVSSDDIVWALFTGASCSALSEAVCENLGGISYDTAYFRLAAGQRYWILIGKASNSQPFGNYNVTFTVIPPSGACCSGTDCTITTQAACGGAGGSWLGAFTSCVSPPQYGESVAAAIPDRPSGSGSPPGEIVRTINITDNTTITDLKVVVDFAHSGLGDLHMFITSPFGTEFDLVNRIRQPFGTLTSCPSPGTQCALGDVSGEYTFDDQADTPYGPDIATAINLYESATLAGTLPSGRYKPVTCLEQVVSLNEALGGQTTLGNWSLTIRDYRTGNSGVLNSWGLIVNGGSEPPCAFCPGDFNHSGNVSVQDIFDFLGAWFGNDLSADVDGSGTVTLQDLFDFLGAWFTPCP